MILTNWFSTRKNTFIATIGLVFLASCSTTKQAKQENVSVKKVPVIETVATEHSAEELVHQAIKQDSSQAVNSFIVAAKLYLIEAMPHKALWLANQTAPLTHTKSQQYQLLIVKAKSLLALKHAEKAFQTIESANDVINNTNLKHGFDYYQTLAAIQFERKLPIVALDASLRAFANNTNATSGDIDNIWQQLCQLSQWQHQQLLKLAAPGIKGWSKLLTFANKFGNDYARLQRYLSQWQREYTTHPAQHIVSQLQALEVTVSNTINNIAVIIPLSGKQERAGKVAQQGILAAYDKNTAVTLHFIDSNTLDMSLLATQFEALSINYVVGPLLKENVKSYLSQENLTVPTLLLNIPGNVVLKPHQVALSMRPEDEAVQAATTLSRQNYQQPIILSHQDSSSRRIAQKFSQQWQHITGKQPDIVFFNRDAKMQKQLKASLGVDLSQQRTDELNKRIKYSIKNELRNRRDVDMIYIVGLPLETKLLKPYIDVNTSPFADIIPVYASSRSHSAKNDKSDNRDLSGLIFTEMPWQLPSKQQNKALAAQAKKLWPNRSDGLHAIFAMGYDSLGLVEKLSAMQEKAYVRHYGQTGILQLATNNILKRSLVWGKYSRNKVQEIAMD